MMMTSNASLGGRTYRYRLALLGLAGLLTACDLPTLLNNVTSLGGGDLQSRGTVGVAFVNNTPYFAIFTFGSYDPLMESDPTGNDSERPDFRQFFANAAHPNERLERNSTSETFELKTGRVISLGSQAFLDAIRVRNPQADLTGVPVGITFSDLLSTDPAAKTVTINRFNHQTQALGVNYLSGALVMFSFELDATQPGGIRVDIAVVLPPL